MRPATANGLAELTAQEREILQCICQGYRDRDIAQGLSVSEKTVQNHVQSILRLICIQGGKEESAFTS